MKADEVFVYSDSQLVLNHLNKDYKAKDPGMNKDVSQVMSFIKKFNFVIEWIGREHNAHMEALAGPALVYATSGGRTIYLGEINKPSFEPGEEEITNIQLGLSWMDEILAFLKG